MMSLYKNIWLLLGILIGFSLLTGCTTISVKQKNILPPNTDQWLLTRSKIYHLTSEGLKEEGFFEPWYRLLQTGKITTLSSISYDKEQNRIYFFGGNPKSKSASYSLYYLNLNKPNSYPIILLKEFNLKEFGLIPKINLSPNGKTLVFFASHNDVHTHQNVLDLFALDTTSYKVRLLKKNFWNNRDYESIDWFSNYELIYRSSDYKNAYLFNINTLQETNFQQLNSLTAQNSYEQESISPSRTKLLLFKVTNWTPPPIALSLCIADLQQNTLSTLQTYYLDVSPENKFLWLPDESGFLLFSRWERSNHDDAYFFSLKNNKAIYLGPVKSIYYSTLLPKIDKKLIINPIK